MSFLTLAEAIQKVIHLGLGRRHVLEEIASGETSALLVDGEFLIEEGDFGSWITDLEEKSETAARAEAARKLRGA